ncbi:MAG: hypothetical protein ACK558_13710 [Pseudomonadota bacterium]
MNPPSQQPPAVRRSISWRLMKDKVSPLPTDGNVTVGLTKRWSDTVAAGMPRRARRPANGKVVPMAHVLAPVPPACCTQPVAAPSKPSLSTSVTVPPVGQSPGAGWVVKLPLAVAVPPAPDSSNPLANITSTGGQALRAVTRQK